MDTEQSFKNFQTVAFSTEIMRILIGHGEPIIDSSFMFHGFDKSANPCVLNMDVWFKIVPEDYQLECVDIILFLEKGFLKRPITKGLIDEFIDDFQKELSGRRVLCKDNNIPFPRKSLEDFVYLRTRLGSGTPSTEKCEERSS